MQSLMFVFAGFQKAKSDDNLIILLERLSKVFSEKPLSISFTKKGNLLTSSFEDVGFYISIFSKEKEVKDWYQMAEDFELAAEPNPVNTREFEERLTQKKLRSPELYKDVHYLIGRNVFAEMNNFNLSQVYFFL